MAWRVELHLCISAATSLLCHAKWHLGLGRGYRSMIDVISASGSDMWQEEAMWG